MAPHIHSEAIARSIQCQGVVLDNGGKRVCRIFLELSDRSLAMLCVTFAAGLHRLARKDSKRFYSASY